MKTLKITGMTCDGCANHIIRDLNKHNEIDTVKIDSWQDWRNWNFRSGCRSALKRIFLTEGAQVFIMGQEFNNKIFKDFEGDQEMWDDDTPWSDYSGWNPVANENDSGVPIKFIWELPWIDNNKRFHTKNNRYINFDTTGDNRFLVEMFTDNGVNDVTVDITFAVHSSKTPKLEDDCAEIDDDDD